VGGQRVLRSGTLTRERGTKGGGTRGALRLKGAKSRREGVGGGNSIIGGGVPQRSGYPDRTSAESRSAGFKLAGVAAREAGIV